MRKPVLVLGQCLAWSSSGCLSCLLAPVAAAGAWTHDAARCGVHAGDVVALDSTANMDAGAKPTTRKGLLLKYLSYAIDKLKKQKLKQILLMKACPDKCYNASINKHQT